MYFSSQLPQFSPLLLTWIRDIIKFGLDRASIEDCRESIDSIIFMCQYQYRIWISGIFFCFINGWKSSHEYTVGIKQDCAVSETLDLLMDCILQLAIFKQIDSQLLNPLADCLFLLITLKRVLFFSLLNFMSNCIV